MEILKLREHRELLNKASVWFHSKWGVPVEAYEESIKESLKKYRDCSAMVYRTGR